MRLSNRFGGLNSFDQIMLRGRVVKFLSGKGSELLAEEATVDKRVYRYEATSGVSSQKKQP